MITSFVFAILYSYRPDTELPDDLFRSSFYTFFAFATRLATSGLAAPPTTTQKRPHTMTRTRGTSFACLTYIPQRFCIATLFVCRNAMNSITFETLLFISPESSVTHGASTLEQMPDEPIPVTMACSTSSA